MNNLMANSLFITLSDALVYFTVTHKQVSLI